MASTPLLKKAIITGITDRIAFQHETIRSGIEAANVGGYSGAYGFFYPRIHDGMASDPLQPLGDASFEANTVQQADDVDNNFASGAFIASIYSPLLAGLNAYLTEAGYSNLDAYLYALDLNVHEDFDSVYRAANGSDLDAVNVFRRNHVTMGTLASTGSGTGTFTDGSALGTGTGKFNAASNSAGQQLEIVSSGAGAANNTVLNMTVLNEDGTTTSNLTITLPAGSFHGTVLPVGSASVNGDIIDIVTCQFSGGNNGQQVIIRNKVERNSSL